MNDDKTMYIDGAWVSSISGDSRDIINPANGQVIATVVEGSTEDVNQAVQAARRAFEEEWCTVSAAERAQYLFTIADGIEAQTEALAELEVQNNGKPLREALSDVSDAVACFRYYAGLTTKPHGQTFEVSGTQQSMVIREPLGVCGQIIPWNFPLMMSAWKLAPALAAGNSVIFKPAELTPLTAIRLFEIIADSGLPAGVANLVLGAGATVGQAMAEHPDIDKISFTGGTETGRKVMQAATGNLKKLSLELGGKSPNIVFADADFETAIDYALFASFLNQGQVCAAGSRLLVEASIYDAFIDELADRARKIRVGDGMNPATEMGPLISEAQMNKVLDYIRIGREEGARCLCGGQQLLDHGHDQGYFVAPTIFADTTPDMRIVREEIFGPVLVIQKFSDEAEAIQLANDSIYGLAGGIFTQHIAKGNRVARKLRAGITWINCYHTAHLEAPWGGYKQSGIGRELGTYGYDAYTEVKQINTNLQIKPVGWFENQ